jgi:uncharacterized protein DUF1348
MTDQKTPVREPWEKEENATRPPLPPFSRETAIQKIRAAEAAWNSIKTAHLIASRDKMRPTTGRQ